MNKLTKEQTKKHPLLSYRLQIFTMYSFGTNVIIIIIIIIVVVVVVMSE